MPLRRARPRKRSKGKRASLGRQADALWSMLVKRPGRCCVEECSTPTDRLQAAHGISRRYRNTRWLLINGFPLCCRHHTYWTHRPLEWSVWLRHQWGGEMYDELHRMALRTTKADIGVALETLNAEQSRSVL